MKESNKINISFILPSLVAGGAERVISFIAQNIDKTKFNVTLLVLGFQKDSVYKIDDINTIYLNKKRVLKAIPYLINYSLFKKQDIIISAIGHLNTVMAYISLITPKTKFIAREVNILSALKTFQTKNNFLLEFLGKYRFNFFDAIICQSRDMYEDLISNYNLNSNKIVIINNPITDNFYFSGRKSESKILRLVTVARLKKQKGHLRILNALSKVNFPFHYTIIGDGPEMDIIFKLIDQLKLSNQITHVKHTDEVPKYLRENDLYLQGSYIEGFPNAVIESCAVGTPVLAFSAPGGLNEIIKEPINGFIVNSEQEYINHLLEINSRFPFSPEEVSLSVQKKYSKTNIIKEYENLFTDLLNL
ncbi:MULTISPECIES: glycosyltransferase [Mangrovimonas]|uniref:glycosyltransferase n=1 Tax=Mangrovimonas TaxID=1211036 RepID=UPI000975C30B|nr:MULTISPECIES: glycosyltransferase [Mangrovimonas]OMP30688.1 glycosyl transferase [Mangrovimonas sp. DI 80]